VRLDCARAGQVSVSTESTLTSAQSDDRASTCAECRAVLAEDQLYCLECGRRRPPMSSLLLRGHPPTAPGPTVAGATSPPRTIAEPPAAPRQSTTALLAGVGVLLLAMGVGVLIGRAGTGRQPASTPQVVSVSTTPAASTTGEAPFSNDWPSGTSGYTVKLQALPQSSSKVSAVQAAKAAAAAKGAENVGALRSEDFSSLAAGSYVIYSGVYHRKAEAEKALRGLKKSFPGASVIAVSAVRAPGGAGSPPASPSAEGASGGGTNLIHPAPPSVLEDLHKSKGQSYEQKSKNLPNVVSTG
jgi:hypothetical protein